MLKKPLVKTMSLILVLGMLAGCGSAQTDNQKAEDKKQLEKPKEPIELTLVPYYLNMSDEQFDELLFKPLKEKYPYITMKLNRTDPANLALAGDFPDIFYTSNSRFTTFSELDIPFDMSPMVKANNLDLNAFLKPNIDWIKELGSKGEVYGIPFDLNQQVLLYNKDIFDKRGVPYPKDGMTWDDVLELSKKLTFNEGGVQYRGLVPPNPENLVRTKSLPFADPKTNKSLIDNAQNKSNLELLQSFYTIPGVIVNNEFPIKGADFFKEQTTAMNVTWLADSASYMQSNGVKMNYDMVGAPSFKDLPGVTIDPGAKMMGISKTSKHKEDDFKVIQFFASPEVQATINRRGRFTALADEKIRNDFGAEMDVLKGKNIQGVLKVKPAKMAPPHPYTAIVTGKINGMAKDLALGTKDINTILREAQESSDQAILQDLAAKKK
jgi:multiple sugar transport system substrate-binding protein